MSNENDGADDDQNNQDKTYHRIITSSQKIKEQPNLGRDYSILEAKRET